MSILKYIPAYHNNLVLMDYVNKAFFKSGLTITSHIPSCLRGKNLSLNSSTLVSAKVEIAKEVSIPKNVAKTRKTKVL